MKYHVHTSGLVAALLATSSLTADGIVRKLETFGLTSHDVHFSKNDSDQLEIAVTNERAMETISKMESLPTLDARDADARFMKPTSDHTYLGTAMYEAVIASLPAGKQPSHERWMRIVNDLDASTKSKRLMPKTAGKKPVTESKVAKTA